MKRNPNKRMIAAVPESELLDTLIDVASESFDVRVTIAESAAEAIDLDQIRRHDLIVAATSLPDMDTLDFIREIQFRHRRPVVLVGGSPDVQLLIGAMRLGVSDVIPSPVATSVLFQAIARAMRGSVESDHRHHREQRLRSLVRRVLSERRELQQRMELVCHDMVGAHKRLFHRVLSWETDTGFDR
jgi:FixJ family two-component response regulator